MPRRKLLPAGRRKVLLAGGTLVLAVVTACSNSGSPTATPLPPAATATQVPAPATSAPADATRPPSGDDGAVTPALQFVWSVQDVDRGIKPAIVVDSNGVPSVAYMTEALNGFVKVATLEGSDWNVDKLADGYFYGPLDAAIGPDDTIHVAYHDHQAPTFQLDKGDAVYAVLRDGEWQVQAVEAEGHDGWDNRIIVDRSGTPHMTGIDPVEFGGVGVKYYGLDDSGEWQVEPVGSGPLSYKFATSLAVDPQGNPHVTYFDQETRDLKLASRDGSGWNVTSVDRQGDTGLFAFLVIDDGGRFHISYLEQTRNNAGIVKYATSTSPDGPWEITEIASLGALRFGQTGARNITSLALDSNGNPWIAYSDERALNLAVWDGAQWQTQTVVEAGRRPLGQLVSLKIDSQDQPHIAYFEVTNSAPLEGAVKYAKGTASG